MGEIIPDLQVPALKNPKIPVKQEKFFHDVDSNTVPVRRTEMVGPCRLSLISELHEKITGKVV